MARTKQRIVADIRKVLIEKQKLIITIKKDLKGQTERFDIIPADFIRDIEKRLKAGNNTLREFIKLLEDL